MSTSHLYVCLIFVDLIIGFCIHTGREQISELVENAISGNSMGTLIKEPGGCGEQNMIRMTLPVIATLYLDKTNQWETVGIEKRTAAIEHIKTGRLTHINSHKYQKLAQSKGTNWLQMDKIW